MRWWGHVVALAVASCQKSATPPEPVSIPAAPPADSQSEPEASCRRFIAPETRVELVSQCVELGTQFASTTDFQTCLAAAEHIRLIRPLIAKRIPTRPPRVEDELPNVARACPEMEHLPCLADAKTADDVVACMGGPFFVAVMIRASNAAQDRPEAVSELEGIADLLRASFARDHKFPVGTAGLTPPASCCNRTGFCALSDADWETPVWKAVGYKPKVPPLYQFRYESDGKTLRVTAIGDMDCDKTTVTYTLEGTIEGSDAKFHVVPAPNGID